MRRGEERRANGRPRAVTPVPTPGRGAVRLSLHDLVVRPVGGAVVPISGQPGFLALWLRPGRWEPPTTPHADFVVSVLAGALMSTRGRIYDLLLEGDLAEVDPASDERWKVLSPSPALIALLTSATLAELSELPDVSRALLLAQNRQHRRNLELRAITGIYDVEERIGAFFAHLARHIGHPEGDATRIPLALDQRRVEKLVSAGHTQATTAFRSLVHAGILARDADGWLMRRSAPNTPPAQTCSAPNPFASALPSGPSAA
jgi:hypothetical protein